MIYNKTNKMLMEEMPFMSERELQTYVSQNLDLFFGAKLIKNEYQISFFDAELNQQQTGRIDSLAIDENGSPVIIEYKLEQSSNLINQALYYLDWLRNNKRQFELEIKLFDETIEIAWSNIRVICIAKSFNKYDYNAIRQIDANVELYRYQNYDDIFELIEVYKKNQKPNKTKSTEYASSKNSETELLKTTHELRGVFDQLVEDFKEQYDEELTINYLSDYIAFKINKNILTVVPQRSQLKLYTNNVKNECIDLFEDVSSKGHWGTGNYCFTISNISDYKKFVRYFKF